MNAIKRHLGLMVSGAIVAASVWACTATRHPDGSVEVEFSPDMTIKTKGLEDALRKLNDLLASCLSGAYPRPCTDGEIDDIVNALERVLRRKMKESRSGSAGTG